MNDRQLIKSGAVLAIWSLVACSAPQQPPIISAAPSLPTYTPYQSITLERTDCYGGCPMYKVTISGSGKVSYEGKESVKVKGKAQTSLTTAQVKTLEKAIAEVKLDSFQNEYIADKDGCKVFMTDAPSAIITVSTGKQTKSIHHYLGCDGQANLEQLTRFEDTIDTVVNSAQWVKKK
jgi:Domain of unknown function (DUF6438)